MELTHDLLVEKACLLIVSYFCIATELRLTGQQARGWHKKALETARRLLPSGCPLTVHVAKG